MADHQERKELKANWKTDVEVETCTLAEVSKHNSKNDLWIVIHGKVYDVTEYARDHPGGVDALLEVAGTDATSAYEDVGHSEDAREIMHPYLGKVLQGQGEAQPAKSKSPSFQVVRRRPETRASEQTSSFITPPVKVAILAAGAAAIIWVAQRAILSAPGVQHHIAGHEGGFKKGLLLGVGTCSMAGLLGVKWLSSHADLGGSDFTKLPAHKPSASPAHSHHLPAGVITPSEYRKFALRSKKELSPGIFHFVFDLPKNYSVLGLPIGQHIAIRGLVDEHTVTRSYTPISNNRDLGRLELLIRIYPDGQLGQYMSALRPGDAVDIRGPKGAMRYRKGMSKHLGMIGGGTGITPLFQIIRAICEDPTDDTTISLVYGNRSESDIMLGNQLAEFERTSDGRFKAYYTLDHPQADWKGGRGYITKDLLQERMPAPSSDTKILCCGPPGLVNSAIKSLVALGFESPSAVCKMTDQVFCF